MTIPMTPRALSPPPSATASHLLRLLIRAPRNAPENLPMIATARIATPAAATPGWPSAGRSTLSPAVTKKIGESTATTMKFSATARSTSTFEQEPMTMPQTNAPALGSGPRAPGRARGSEHERRKHGAEHDRRALREGRDDRPHERSPDHEREHDDRDDLQD